MEDKGLLLTALEVLAGRIKELENDLNYERMFKERAERDLTEYKEELNKLKGQLVFGNES